MAVPDTALRDHLETQLSLTTGTSIFAGNRVEPGDGVDDKAIFVRLTGGPTPERTLGAGQVVRKSRVQVWVRGDRHEGSDAHDFARNAWDNSDNATVSGFMDVYCLESEPQIMEPTEQGHPQYAFNVEMWHE